MGTCSCSCWNEENITKTATFTKAIGNISVIQKIRREVKNGKVLENSRTITVTHKDGSHPDYVITLNDLKGGPVYINLIE